MFSKRLGCVDSFRTCCNGFPSPGSEPFIGCIVAMSTSRCFASNFSHCLGAHGDAHARLRLRIPRQYAAARADWPDGSLLPHTSHGTATSTGRCVSNRIVSTRAVFELTSGTDCCVVWIRDTEHTLVERQLTNFAHLLRVVQFICRDACCYCHILTLYSK